MNRCLGDRIFGETDRHLGNKYQQLFFKTAEKYIGNFCFLLTLVGIPSHSFADRGITLQVHHGGLGGSPERNMKPWLA